MTRSRDLGDGPHRAWGSALTGRDGIDPLATPPLITEFPRRMTRKEFRGPPCPVCGEDGPHFCGCEEEV